MVETYLSFGTALSHLQEPPHTMVHSSPADIITSETENIYNFKSLTHH